MRVLLPGRKKSPKLFRGGVTGGVLKGRGIAGNKRLMLARRGWGRTLETSHFHILLSTRSERAMMVFGGIRQMLSLCPENVNNGRASFRFSGFNVCTTFL
jgi:predicted phage tail protein